MVQHFHIEFIDGILPVQSPTYRPCQVFNKVESEIIEAEIHNLLAQKVVKEVQFVEGQFLSPIFLRKKKNGEFRLNIFVLVLSMIAC